MIDTKGKVILTAEGLIKQAANGHGGIFEAMFNNDIHEFSWNTDFGTNNS